MHFRTYNKTRQKGGGMFGFILVSKIVLMLHEVMVCDNSSGALSGCGKLSIGIRAWEPYVASWSTRMKGGAAKHAARGSPSSDSR